MMRYFNGVSGPALPVQLSSQPLQPKLFADGSLDRGEAAAKSVLNCLSKLNLAVVRRAVVKLSLEISSGFCVRTGSRVMFEGCC